MEGNRGSPGPGGALGDEIVAGEEELGDAEVAFLLEGGDGAGPSHPLHGALEGLVKLLGEHH